MVVVDGQGVPLGGTITAASPAEVRLPEETLGTIKVPQQGRGRPKSRPKCLIGDKAYYSDKLPVLQASPRTTPSSNRSAASSGKSA